MTVVSPKRWSARITELRRRFLSSADALSAAIKVLPRAEKYPADFNGIVSGAPSLSWNRLNAARIDINLVVHKSDDSYLPPQNIRCFTTP